jgi:hypothetical protein
MPGPQPGRELLPLCHEHHVKMRVSNLKSEGRETQTVAYACTESDCPVHYNISSGYYMLSRDRNLGELDMVPKISCPRDRTPMYLAEIDPEKRSFRLWRCPVCDLTLTNEEGLAAGER